MAYNGLKVLAMTVVIGASGVVNSMENKGFEQLGKPISVPGQLLSVKQSVEKTIIFNANGLDDNLGDLSKKVGIDDMFLSTEESPYKNLAGPVPSGFFESGKGKKYYNEIQESFGIDVAEKFKEYSEYFSSIVEEGKEEYIIKKLTAVFYNPGEESPYNRFMGKLNKKLKKGQVIDELKLSEMNSLLKQVGEVLKGENKELTLALASQDEIIKLLDKKLEKLIYDRLNLEGEWKELDRLEKKLDKESALFHIKLLKVRNNIKKNRETIKMLDRAIYFMKEDIKGLNNI